jgi:hypothetical protein
MDLCWIVTTQGLGPDWGKGPLYCYEDEYPKCVWSPRESTSSPLW